MGSAHVEVTPETVWDDMKERVCKHLGTEDPETVTEFSNLFLHYCANVNPGTKRTVAAMVKRSTMKETIAYQHLGNVIYTRFEDNYDIVTTGTTTSKHIGRAATEFYAAICAIATAVLGLTAPYQNEIEGGWQLWGASPPWDSASNAPFNHSSTCAQ